MEVTARWGIIGGTGLEHLEGVQVEGAMSVSTPYGTPSEDIVFGDLEGVRVAFLPRHGPDHRLAPHQINYRANIWALAQHVKAIIAVAAVGSINPSMRPGDIVLADQVIDYTWGREHTYWDAQAEQMAHVDFTKPYDERVRAKLRQAARAAAVDIHDGGTYAATQGPRLESAAEIDRLQRDGCDVVGMTGMPEAGLARELGIPYGCCAVVVNPAAGRGPSAITMDMIEANLVVGMAKVHRLLRALTAAPE
ncbi:MAG: S-methyl-5'-thioinosine phosphorylase [Gammaproteobacteria bacterium]|nr:S-methyl-5'-thioinosine phosphorylase [Gammaproteobacteria bacterium]